MITNNNSQRTKGYWLAILILVLVGLILTACSGVDAAEEAERPPLKVEWTYWPGYYPMAIAIELGLFEKHNVKIEPLLYESGAEARADFSAKKLDGAMFVTGNILDLATQTPLKVALAVDMSDGGDAIVATSDIKSVADLRGKRVGYSAGDFGELFVRRMLEQGGLTENDVTLVTIESEAVPESLSDLIDAGNTWDPYIGEAIAAGHHVIFTSTDTPGLIADVVVFHASVVEERPEDIRAFVAAWFEAVEYWETHPEEATQMIAKQTGLKPEEISKEGLRVFDLEDNKAAFSRDTDISLFTSTEQYVDLFIANGTLGSQPDLDQLFDGSFLE